MATAEKKIAPVKYNVVLTLDQNEAETLLFITGKVGGSPETSRRRFVDEIRAALQKADVKAVQASCDEERKSVWFNHEKVEEM